MQFLAESTLRLRHSNGKSFYVMEINQVDTDGHSELGR